ALAAREAVNRPRIFLQEPNDGSRQVRQCRRVSVALSVQRLWRRRTEGLPCACCQVELCVGDGLTRIEERGQLVRSELAEPSEPGAARKRSDAHQAHHLAGGEALANPRQQLNEIQLIEEIVLEPQDQLFVELVMLDNLAPSRQVVYGIDVRGLRPCQISRTDVYQLGIREIAWNRALVQGIGPDRQSAGNRGCFDGHRRRRAIGHVKKACRLATHVLSLSARRPWTVDRLALNDVVLEADDAALLVEAGTSQVERRPVGRGRAQRTCPRA